MLLTNADLLAMDIQAGFCSVMGPNHPLEFDCASEVYVIDEEDPATIAEVLHNRAAAYSKKK